jgi:molybdopterin molybdotransferase
MIPVADALARIAALMPVMEAEDVAVPEAAGRALAAPVAARRDQPPFPASAMDGYAVRAADATPGARLRVVAEIPAGQAWAGTLGAGEAARLFTGAPVPEGADAVVIQEDVDADGDTAAIREAPVLGAHIRPRGNDFAAGAPFAPARRLSAEDLSLLTAMNVTTVSARRRPRIALIPTGDELVEAGEEPGPAQIVASTHIGLAALLARHGAVPYPQPIARDSEAALRDALDAARAAGGGVDLIVTLGGASVGEHDHVGAVVGAENLDFYKVAMRPGKPLMAGRYRGTPLVGLPGNPVSALVCAHVFLRPALDAMLGLPARPLARLTARLAVDLPAGGPREHYMRATLDRDGGGALTIVPIASQDSARLSGLSEADALLVQPPHAPALPAGAPVPFVPLRPLD